MNARYEGKGARLDIEVVLREVCERQEEKFREEGAFKQLLRTAARGKSFVEDAAGFTTVDTRPSIAPVICSVWRWMSDKQEGRDQRRRKPEQVTCQSISCSLLNASLILEKCIRDSNWPGKMLPTALIGGEVRFPKDGCRARKSYVKNSEIVATKKLSEMLCSLLSRPSAIIEVLGASKFEVLIRFVISLWYGGRSMQFPSRFPATQTLMMKTGYLMKRSAKQNLAISATKVCLKQYPRQS